MRRSIVLNLPPQYSMFEVRAGLSTHCCGSHRRTQRHKSKWKILVKGKHSNFFVVVTKSIFLQLVSMFRIIVTLKQNELNKHLQPSLQRVPQGDLLV
jgi:hypothetical protein